MRRLTVLLLMLCFTLAPYAQRKKPVKKPATTAVKKKPAPQQKKPTKKKQAAPKQNRPVTNENIKKLQNERQNLQQQIKEQEQRLRSNERDVKKRLQDLMTLNTEIEDKKRDIDDIRADLSTIGDTIQLLEEQTALLQEQLNQHRQRYIKSLRYMYRNRSMRSKLMFIFSAKNFTQMYRRMLFMRRYAAYQRTQAEAIQQKQLELTAVHSELLNRRQQKDNLLRRNVTTHQQLEASQAEQKRVVGTLQKEHKTIEAIIAEHRKRDAALNAQIDRLIAEEVARARARAEAEAKRKAEARRKAEAEAAKKRQEELERKRKAAEARKKENERRIAEAREREAKLKAEARAKRQAEAAERKEAERRAREAEQERQAAERRAAEERKKDEREIAEVKREAEVATTLNDEDRTLSGNFESNRGRFPSPVSGGRVVNSFGQYNVEGLKNVRLDNKGINLKAQPGTTVRCIYNGEVSMVFNAGGVTGIIVRHGNYFSVYANLGSVSVKRGQHVSTGQSLGTLGSEGILQFQMRRGKDLLNPMQWLRR